MEKKTLLSKTKIIILILFLVQKISTDACNAGVSKCRVCLPGGNKCSQCSEETYILTKDGICLECNEVKGCKKDQCDHFGCKECEKNFFRKKNEKMEIFYCEDENRINLRNVLWVVIIVVVVFGILGFVFFLSRRKEQEEDLYDKLLSRDVSIRSGGSGGNESFGSQE